MSQAGPIASIGPGMRELLKLHGISATGSVALRQAVPPLPLALCSRASAYSKGHLLLVRVFSRVGFSTIEVESRHNAGQCVARCHSDPNGIRQYVKRELLFQVGTRNAASPPGEAKLVPVPRVPRFAQK
jgi:hypothetical protein